MTKLTKTEKENVPVWTPGPGPISKELAEEAIDAGVDTGNFHERGELRNACQVAIDVVNKALANRGYR